MFEGEATFGGINADNAEPRKTVGRYKTMEEAQGVVDDFFIKYADRLDSHSFFNNELLTGYKTTPILETTKRGYQRWEIIFYVPKPLEEMTSEEKRSLFGKSFKGMPIIYQVSNIELAPREDLSIRIF